MNISREGLIDFINAQPPEREINNDSWYTCAVGAYYEFVTNERIPRNEALTITATLFGNPRTYPTSTLEYNLDHSRFETYGDAQEWIRENE